MDVIKGKMMHMDINIKHELVINQTFVNSQSSYSYTLIYMSSDMFWGAYVN